MNQRTRRTIKRAASIGIAASALLSMSALGAATAHAAPQPASLPAIQPAEDAAACTVTDGTLTWGVKESFRSYISGSIANGSWEATDGATYETPHFTWTGGTGEIDPATGTGSVSFTGTVHFTGHDGVLDLTLANPTLDFEGDGVATLLLDARSTDLEGELALDVDQEWVGDVVAPSSLEPVDERLAIDAMDTTLTNSGVKAFAEFYDAGATLDRLAIDLALPGCNTSAPADSAEPAEPEVTTQAPVEVVETETSVPWVPIIIGGVAILVIGVTVGMLVAGRKKPGADGVQGPTAE